MGEPWTCIGHSHVTALELSQDPDLDCINFWTEKAPWVAGGEWAKLRDELAGRVASGKRVLTMFGGASHTVLGMVEHPTPFDFVLPSQPHLPLDETRRILPVEAVRAKLHEMEGHILDGLASVTSVATGPVTHVGPPPPVADDALIAPFVPWPLFVGQPQLVAPKWVRYKIWRLFNDVLAEGCAQRGVAYQPAPQAAADSEGFLRTAYNRDGAHANGAYGALVLAHLRSAA
jgi:hypothetical protein